MFFQTTLVPDIKEMSVTQLSIIVNWSRLQYVIVDTADNRVTDIPCYRKRGSGGEKLGNQTWSVNLLSHSDNEFHYNWFIFLMICCVFHEELPRPMKIENYVYSRRLHYDLMIEFTILLSNFSNSIIRLEHCIE